MLANGTREAPGGPTSRLTPAVRRESPAQGLLRLHLDGSIQRSTQTKRPAWWQPSRPEFVSLARTVVSVRETTGPHAATPCNPWGWVSGAATRSMSDSEPVRPLPAWRTANRTSSRSACASVHAPDPSACWPVCGSHSRTDRTRASGSTACTTKSWANTTSWRTGQGTRVCTDRNCCDDTICRAGRPRKPAGQTQSPAPKPGRALPISSSAVPSSYSLKRSPTAGLSRSATRIGGHCKCALWRSNCKLRRRNGLTWWSAGRSADWTQWEARL